MGATEVTESTEDTEDTEDTEGKKNKNSLLSVSAVAMRDSLTEQIIGAAIEVHRHLGPGLLVYYD